MNATLRTFVAVEIDAAVRDRAAELIQRLGRAAAGVKWVEPHNLHLTLKFLGDVPAQDITAVINAVHQAAAVVAPFEVELYGAGAFPNASRPRTIWLGTRDGSAEMAQLAAALDRALKPLGFRPEHRKFQAHLTLGRVRNLGRGLHELSEQLWQTAQFAAGSVAVDEVIIFSSELTREGPIYQRLGSGTLGGEAVA